MLPEVDLLQIEASTEKASYKTIFPEFRGPSASDLLSREALQAKFGWEEYIVFALTLMVSAGIGVFFWWKGQNNKSDLLLGGKQMGIVPMAMSLVASFLSAITLLGYPAEIYLAGLTMWVAVFPNAFISVIVAVIYLPVYTTLQVSTSYEYLEWRFNRVMRGIAAILFTIQTSLYMGIVVYVPALAIEQLTGMNTDLVCAVTFVICIFYTSMGGLKAVIWTDTFQVVVMFASLFIFYFRAVIDSGGVAKIWEVNVENDRLDIETTVDPFVRYTVLAVSLGTIFNWLPTFATSQTQVQRYLSVPGHKEAVKALLVNGVSNGVLASLCAFSGLVAFAYYHQAGCDPIASKQASSQDQLMPMFMMQLMGDIPFFPGLFVSGVFSGALSTISSGLNSLAAVFWQDFVVAIFNVHISEAKSTKLTKVIAVCFGIVCYSVIFLVRVVPGSTEASLLIFGVVSSPILGAFTLGMFFPWANSMGSIVGTLMGLAVSTWLSVAQQLSRANGNYVVPLLNTTIESCPEEWLDNLPEEATRSWFPHLRIYELSYMWFGGISLFTTITVGMIVSLLTGPQNPRTLNPDLLTPVVRYCLEEPLQIGRDYVPSEKERRLQQDQIQGKDSDSHRIRLDSFMRQKSIN